MRYLLDSDICVYIRHNRPPEVAARLRRLPPGDVGMSVITYGELMFGAAKSPDAQAAAEVSRMVALAPVLPLPENAGRIYGDIRAVLARQGKLIGPNDLWIAAHAIAAGLTLVTNNEREFNRVEGLKIENWAK